MPKEIEFIDLSFHPRLPFAVTQNYANYLRAVRFPRAGRPAPNLNDQRAAIWVGRRPNDFGEVPVLAFVAPRIRHPDQNLECEDARWNVGYIALTALNDAQYQMDSAFPEAAAAISAAEYGGAELTTPFLAFDLLAAIHPRSSISNSRSSWSVKTYR